MRKGRGRFCRSLFRVGVPVLGSGLVDVWAGAVLVAYFLFVGYLSLLSSVLGPGHGPPHPGAVRRGPGRSGLSVAV